MNVGDHTVTQPSAPGPSAQARAGLGKSVLGQSVLGLLWPRLQSQRNRWLRASRPERITTAFFAVLGVLFWLGLLGLLGWLITAFHGVEVFGPILSRKLLELMMMALFFLLCFSNVVTALSTFYLSDDLELVLSLPISRTRFHFARLIDTVIQSSWMLGFFGVPIFLAYGYAYDAPLTFYLLVLAVLPGFVAIPAAFGLSVATGLVRFFPARKIREGLVLGGILILIVGFVMLRAIRPERLVNAESFESVAAYVAELQTPVPRLTPPRWISDVLTAALMDRPVPWIELGLLISGAIAATGLARWLTGALYDEGRARAQEASRPRLARAGWLDRLIDLYTRPLPRVMAAIVAKDIKTFVRNPAQWSQVFLVGSIIVIALISVSSLPVDMFRGPWAPFWRNLFAFGAHALVGFIIAAVAARFQFTAVSTEARAFWIVRTGPITAEQLLWAKVWPTLPPLIIVGQILSIASTMILGARPFLVVVSSLTALGLSLAISGLAVGMGAIYPDFKADNASRVAAGPAGMLFMVLSTLLTFLVVVLEIAPVWLVISAEAGDRTLGPLQWVAVAVPLLMAAGVCVAVTLIAMRRGARSLWARELPNS